LNDFSDMFDVMPDPNAGSGVGASSSPRSGASPGASSSPQSGAPPGATSVPPQTGTRPPPLTGLPPLGPAPRLREQDFLIYPAKHKAIYRPTREFWNIEGTNACFPPRMKMSFTTWMARNNQRVDSVTWHPGEGEIIFDRIAVRDGWVPEPGERTFNTYMPPTSLPGDAAQATRWVDHLNTLYPDEADRITAWLAHRVQYPGIKPNYCQVLAGDPGIGKDMLLVPMRDAVGPWNCVEIQLHNLGSAFNDFQACVLLRISEARDSGDGTTRGRIDRYTLNDRMKPLLASPPESFRLNRKWEPEYPAFNICGVVITTNHDDALYVTPDDRRYDAHKSRCKAADFSPEFFKGFFHWYEHEGGIGHVVAYLRAYDLSKFNPHAAPPKTAAFWNMVAVDLGPEHDDLEDALDALGKPDPDNKDAIIRPDAVTLAELSAKAPGADWLRDRKQHRALPHRLKRCGYVSVRNPDVLDSAGRWRIKRGNTSVKAVIYARADLSSKDQLKAARAKAGPDLKVVGGAAQPSKAKKPRGGGGGQSHGGPGQK
jgi:hypothetical protein